VGNRKNGAKFNKFLTSWYAIETRPNEPVPQKESRANQPGFVVLGSDSDLAEHLDCATLNSLWAA
jgi:hypothetical protein